MEWDDDLTCWQVYPGDPKIRQKYNRHKQALKTNPHLQFDGYVYDGDQIRLRHCYSKVALATNDMVSLGSNKTFLREVRGIKWLKQPVEEATWIVELVPEGLVPGLADHYGNMKKGTQRLTGASENDRLNKQDAQEADKRDRSKQWHSIKGFRLWNEKQRCYLQSHKVSRSPFSTYQEVACVQGGRQKANTIFIVDQNVNPYCTQPLGFNLVIDPKRSFA